MKIPVFVMICGSIAALTATSLFAQDLGSGVIQSFDGRNFYHHRFRDIEQKPYVDMLCTPQGQNILRDAPPDHYHHHALMFAIRINGVNFWEEYGYPGRQQLTDGTSVQSDLTCGPEETRIQETMQLDWVTQRGTILLQEQRLIRAEMKSVDDPVLLEWVSILTRPDQQKKVEQVNDDIAIPEHSQEMDEKIFLHGSSYNGFGIRFDESMDFGGRFFYSDDSQEIPLDPNFDLHKNHQCRWVAYTSKLNGQPVTVALYDLGSAIAPKDALRNAPYDSSPFDFFLDAKNFPAVKRIPMVTYSLNDPTENRTNAYLSATANIFREPLYVEENEAVVFCYAMAIWEGEQTSEEVEEISQQWKLKIQDE